MWYGLSVLVFALGGCSSQADTDYHCSQALGCQCAAIPDEDGEMQVQLHCLTPWITTAHNWSHVPAQHTTWLTIECQSQDFSSKFEYSPFAHLAELDELRIGGCRFVNLTNDAFLGLANLRTLLLNDIGSPSLISGLFDPLLNLQHLNLANNAFLTFPDYLFCGLNNLNYLNLSNNALGEETKSGLALGGHDTCLPNLITLDFSGNHFLRFQYSLAEAMPSLQYVYFYPGHLPLSTKIGHLSNRVFQNLSDLVVIDLTNNALTTLGDSLFKGLGNIRALYLGDNKLTKINPGAFYDNSNLLILELQGNGIGDDVTKPEVLGHLINLFKLDLSRNRISTVPSSTFSRFEILETLAISSNSISYIAPGTFHGVPRLKNLDLSHNMLDMIRNGTFLGLSNLVDLKLAENMITNIEPGAFSFMANLSNLDLSGNRLTRVPDIFASLNNLQSLNLGNNRLTEIDARIFSGLSSLAGISISGNKLTYIPQKVLQHCPNLVVLNLSKNNITILEYGAFKELSKLQYINLEYNQIADISLVFNELPSLIGIMFAHNELTGIDSTMFPSFIFSLDLSFNKISRIGNSAFQYFPALYLVNLTYNALTTLTGREFLKSPSALYRPQLYLRSNNLKCDCNMNWLKKINSLSNYFFVQDLDNVYCVDPSDGFHQPITTYTPDKFTCEYRLACVERYCPCCRQSSSNPGCDCLFKCPERCDCYYNLNRSYNVVYCSGRNQTSLPHRLHYGASHIMLDGNNLSYISRNVFQNNSHCEILLLNHSRIMSIQQGAFDGLESLRYLYLHHNLIPKVLYWTFSGLSNLFSLHLDHNLISHVDHESFNDLNKLQFLSLHQNHLSGILSEMFDNSSVAEITLSGNPWSCGCDAGPRFRQWLIGKAQLVVDSVNITCYVTEVTQSVVKDKYNMTEIHDVPLTKNNGRNETLQKRKVFLLEEDFSFCDGNSTYFKYLADKKLRNALISVSIVVVILMMITLIIYNTRELIKVWLFTHYGLRFRTPPEDDTKIYDAFISYSSKDERLVANELAPALEKGNPSFRLCLHYRDWKVGACIADTIIESVEKSKRTVLILSDNFIKSEWCQYEFKTAHYQVMKEKKNRIIVILLEDRPPKGMDRDLKLYIKTNTYLKWRDPWFWDRLRYAMPDKHEKVPEVINDGEIHLDNLLA